MNKLSKQVLIDIDYIKSELTLIQKKSRSRIVVYSCVTNNYDNQISVNNFSSKFDLIIFKDKKTEIEISNNYISNTIEFNFELENPRLTNRLFKILPHLFFEMYDLSLYFDANVELINIDEYINKYSTNEFTLFKHNKRDCLYKEAKECIFWNKDKKENLINQIRNYRNQGYEDNLGLYMGRVLLRKHNELKFFSHNWWDHLNNFSIRDQISLAFLINTTELNYKILLSKNFFNFFDVRSHPKEIYYSNSWFQTIRQNFLIGLIKIKNKLKL